MMRRRPGGSARQARAGAAYRDLRASKQTLRPRDQHDRHDQELGDQRELGKVHGKPAEVNEPDANAQRLDLGDEHGGDIGADDRAHAADDHHHKGVADGRQIHAEIGRLAREPATRRRDRPAARPRQKPR